MATNKRVIVIPSLRAANDLQVVLNSNRQMLTRPGSSVSGDSSSGVVEKPKRKRQRLDHLTQDEKIMRRKMKNRMAAQTARDRKKMKMNDLESEVTRLAHTNEQLVKKNILLKNRLAEIENENKRLRTKLHKFDSSFTGMVEKEENGASSEYMINLLEELSGDIELDMDEILKFDNSDMASDDSGYLLSDNSSRNSGPDGSLSSSDVGNASNATTTTAGTGPGNTSQASLSVNSNALESAAFINEPQQQEQVLESVGRAVCAVERASPVSKSTVEASQTSPMDEAWRMPQSLLSLVKIAEQELANLSSSQMPAATRQPDESRSKTRSKAEPMPAATLSYRGRLRTFLMLLHLLCLKGMATPGREKTKSSLMTTLLRISTRLSLWNLSSVSILENLIRTAHLNLESSIDRTCQDVFTREDNIILKRFLKSMTQKMDNSDAPNDL